ncbi:MAG: DUF4159 domain-containing protein [Chthoniobacter sp.]|uniref:DUF4159 domain-containing protein n=1 Tax=Chthoniobacter sp. TaxID=2510640 RepID=UPI0032AA6E52
MQANRQPFSTKLIEYFSKAQFFTVSALLHAVLILLLGGTVLVQNLKDIPDFTSEAGTLVNADPTVERPPEETVTLKTDTSLANTEVANVAMAPSTIAALTTTNPTPSSFSMPSTASTMPVMKSDTLKAPAQPKAPTTGTGLSKDIAKKISNFTAGWAVGGTASMSKPLKSREFVFTAYLAKYQGGDWDSTVRLEPDGRVWAGSLPNLLYIITKLSKKKINAGPQVQPLDLSSDEIFVKKPPFIWFTGHRDFKLTDKEVENLGEYLRRGGCIWGDSSLPGQRSRFDIAFRREMLRLVPDPNQPWKELPATHPIFTHAWYSEVKAVAPGVNFYDEPIYALMGYGGEIAVLYTANDYGDMWQFGIDEKGDIDLSRDEKKRMVAVNEEMWYRRNLYYRNIEPKALFDTYKFGTNIIIHLLTRWEEKLRNVPQMGN